MARVKYSSESNVLANSMAPSILASNLIASDSASATLWLVNRELNTEFGLQRIGE